MRVGSPNRSMVGSLLIAAATVTLHTQPSWHPAFREPAEPSTRFVCGTRRPDDIRAAAVPAPTPDGHPIAFVQDPAILQATYTGPVRFREFLVSGDVPEVQFFRREPDDPEGGALETWARVTTRTVNGHLVSVFEPSWPNEVFVRLLKDEFHGFDYPTLYWGAFRVAGTDPPVEYAVSLRLGPLNLPTAEVVRLSDTVQYASHVVNLVIPGFGDARVSAGSYAFEEAKVAKAFYEHFADDYDSLAIVPAALHLASFRAFHVTVRNEVEGIGLARFDATAQYGSTGRLANTEVFVQSAFTSNSTSGHEISHQWGHYFDWSRIMGVTRGGYDPSSHAPLLFPRETLIGAVLRGTRRVRERGSASYDIEATPAPIRQHPLELYAMGILPPEAVPDVTVFDDQAQFGVHPTTPAPGTVVSGGARRVSINEIMAVHGPRRGPVPAEWRRATILVSSSGLASQAEMNYWNFFAARLEDPNRTGVLSYDGYPSFEVATGGAVDVVTRIVPTAAPAMEQAHDVDYPRFGRAECRDVVFDELVPSLYEVRNEVRLDARVVVRDHDYSQLLLRFWRTGGTSDQAPRFYDTVSASGSTSPRVLFREGEEGLYLFQVFLFWPDADPQYARCTLTPVVVRRRPD